MSKKPESIRTKGKMYRCLVIEVSLIMTYCSSMIFPKEAFRSEVILSKDVTWNEIS